MSKGSCDVHIFWNCRAYYLELSCNFRFILSVMAEFSSRWHGFCNLLEACFGPAVLLRKMYSGLCDLFPFYDWMVGRTVDLVKIQPLTALVVQCITRDRHSLSVRNAMQASVCYFISLSSFIRHRSI